MNRYGRRLEAGQDELDIAAIDQGSDLPQWRVGDTEAAHRGLIGRQCATGPEAARDLHCLHPAIDIERPSVALARRGAGDAFVTGGVLRPPWQAMPGEIAWSGENDTPRVCEAPCLEA